MNLTQNPFSVYDFLGYLIPGIFSIIGIYLIQNLPVSINNIQFDSIVTYQNSIILLIFCYLLGHLLSFLSSITIEKYSVWTLGYPSTYLFAKKPIGFWESITSKYESNHKFGSIARIISRIIMKIAISIFIFPVMFMDIIVRHVFRLYDQYARPLDEDLRKIVRRRLCELLHNRFNEDINDNCNSDKQDYFRIVYHYAIENAPNHIQKMQNYVAIYGFIRTTTFVFTLFFWAINTRMILNRSFLDLWPFAVIIIPITFILYLDFNKFYRKFSIEAFLASTVTFRKEEKT